MHRQLRASLMPTALPFVLLAVALMAPGGALAAPGAGSLEVCAATDLGALGSPVQLTLNGGAPFSVAVGRCTGPRAVAPGAIEVALASSDTPSGVVDVRPLGRRLAVDPAGRKVVAAVPGGSSASTRTIVTFSAGSGGLGGAGSGPALMEVCVAAANGLADRPFQLALNGGVSFTIVGGSCSGPLTTRPGSNAVRLLPSSVGYAIDASVEPAARMERLDLDAQTVTAQVPAGVDLDARTVVTFVNAPPGGPTDPGPGTGELKVCKTSSTPQFQGRPFSFALNGGPAFSIEAGAPTAPVCSLPVTFTQGTRVLVEELAMTNVVVAAIAVSDGRGADIDPGGRSATAVVGPGTTVVTFDNEPAPVPQLGWVEICKDAEGPDVAGLFEFEVSAPGFTAAASAYVGQCTAPLEVPAGYVTIEELPRAGFELYTIDVEPAERLVGANLINRTLTVEVPVGDPSTETQVHFVNRAIRGQLKVCKALGPASTTLAGRTFLFDVTRHAGSESPGPVERVRVQAASSTQCVVAGAFPVGETLAVDEVFLEDLVPSDPDRPLALSAEFVEASGEGTVTIAPGVNSLTVTNRAVGLLEICKLPVPGLTVQPTFHFRIDAGGVLSVRAGTCTSPRTVAVGEHTVVEMADADFELDPSAAGAGIDVVPGDRLVARNPGLRAVTVLVPFGAEGETRVDFANRVKQGQVKVCKQVSLGSQDALGSSGFDFVVTVGGTEHRVDDLLPGECSLPLPAAPVVRGDGSATPVVVREDGAGPAAAFEVLAIACGGCRSPVTYDLEAGVVGFGLPPGTATVTYTNAIRT